MVLGDLKQWGFGGDGTCESCCQPYRIYPHTIGLVAVFHVCDHCRTAAEEAMAEARKEST